MKKLISLFIAIFILSTTIFAANTSAIEIRPDMDKHFTTVTGYIGGYTDGTVRPNNTITRAEMAQIIFNLLGRPEWSMDYLDTEESVEDGRAWHMDDGVAPYQWYADAFEWINKYHLFTEKVIAQPTSFSSNFYNMRDAFIGVYDSLRLENFGMGKYPIVDSPFIRSLTTEEYAKISKVISWGIFRSEGGNIDQESIEHKDTQVFFADGMYENIKYMILDLYPNGVTPEQLGDPEFGMPGETANFEMMPLVRPTLNMTREEMALVLYRMTTKSYTSTDTMFSDVSYLSAESQTAISCLSSAGVITGYPDGTFGPAKTLTRAEAVTMINRFFGSKVVTNTASTFKPTDLAEHWAAAEITKILK